MNIELSIIIGACSLLISVLTYQIGKRSSTEEAAKSLGEMKADIASLKDDMKMLKEKFI